MAKVFTIIEGVENLGALKTGGQGSVYKAKRTAAIYSAIKILPTPIYSESEDDKNYTSFQNEVAKLKKVNENPNPNVVRILSAGITESGNLPFIEMEYIDGPDLSELLQPPHQPVFTLRETIKICEHLAHALAHCHQLNIKHGDIKTNNVKFNKLTGNYMLLDFGLSVMTDEQRRTSFRNAGAIEFMAPEQHDGHMLFETDIYSFGIIIFELLASTVPFPLKDNSENARNSVMIAHLEKDVPNLVDLRTQAMPQSWDEEKKQLEMQVPSWLLDMINKCLSKKPGQRFADGMKLYDFICRHATSMHAHQPLAVDEHLPKLVEGYKEAIIKKDKELEALRKILDEKNDTYYPDLIPDEKKTISRSAFFTLLILTLALAGFAGYTLFENYKVKESVSENNFTAQDTLTQEKKPDTPVKTTKVVVKNEDTVQDEEPVVEDTYTMPAKEEVLNSTNKSALYKVSTIAHFYDQPDEVTRRTSFLTYKDNYNINVLEETDSYILTELKTHTGAVLKGWLKKSDLRKVNE